MRRNLFSWPALLIVAGSCLFLFALGLSAWLEPDIRWLHFFQAWMYLVTMALALRRNRWGYFIGISAAAFWDYINLFVTNFFIGGLHWLGSWIATGDLKRLDQIVAVPAWLGNFLIIVGCIWGYARSINKSWSDLARLAVAFVLTNGFFALSMALCQPRYLPLFRAALHPHLPRWDG
jgi:hypothetical protein